MGRCDKMWKGKRRVGSNEGIGAVMSDLHDKMLLSETMVLEESVADSSVGLVGETIRSWFVG